MIYNMVNSGPTQGDHEGASTPTCLSYENKLRIVRDMTSSCDYYSRCSVVHGRLYDNGAMPTYTLCGFLSRVKRDLDYWVDNKQLKYLLGKGSGLLTLGWVVFRNARGEKARPEEISRHGRGLWSRFPHWVAKAQSTWSLHLRRFWRTCLL